MASIHIDDKVKALITASYPQAQDAGDDPHKLSTIAYPHVEYSQPEKAEIEQWLITSSHVATATEDPAKTAERLSSLNTHLSTRSTLLGSKPSIADVGMYARLAPIVKLWTPEERTGEQGYHHIVRHLDFVQNSPMFSLKIAEGEKIPVELDNIVAPVKTFDAKAEKEKKKKEKAAAAAAGGEAPAAEKADKPVKEKAKDAGEKAKETGEKIAGAVAAKVPGVKKEKKEKQPKPPKAAAVEKPLSPALIDLRVGHILKCERHPNADSLFVSTINCGDAPGTDNTSEYEGKIVRTVCSGLNGLIPLEDMQDRRVVTVCNLKPVTMRGIKSCAMVLAASPRLAPGVEDNHAGPVELVNPPVAAEAGDRVYFEGWEGEPEPVLNPKKKVWDMCQVGFTTTETKEIAFDVAAVEQLKDSGKTGLATLKTKSGVCTVPTLTGGIVR
jgi:aminoacyl tRNA synthase complex-interacting multifunctional protein 1